MIADWPDLPLNNIRKGKAPSPTRKIGEGAFLLQARLFKNAPHPKDLYK